MLVWFHSYSIGAVLFSNLILILYKFKTFYSREVLVSSTILDRPSYIPNAICDHRVICQFFRFRPSDPK